MSNNYLSQFKNKSVLVTGGMGFIGSSLVLKLVEAGADVTVIDAMIPDYGGNEFNLAPVKDKVRINFSDIRDENAINYLVRGKDYVFHLAGQVAMTTSIDNPQMDFEVNIGGTVNLLEAIRIFNLAFRKGYNRYLSIRKELLWMGAEHHCRYILNHFSLGWSCD